jgi:hypothetical protein
MTNSCKAKRQKQRCRAVADKVFPVSAAVRVRHPPATGVDHQQDQYCPQLRPVRHPPLSRYARIVAGAEFRRCCCPGCQARL